MIRIIVIFSHRYPRYSETYTLPSVGSTPNLISYWLEKSVNHMHLSEKNHVCKATYCARHNTNCGHNEDPNLSACHIVIKLIYPKIEHRIVSICMQNIALYTSPTLYHKLHVCSPQCRLIAPAPTEGISEVCLKYSQFNVYSNANSLEKASGKT